MTLVSDLRRMSKGTFYRRIACRNSAIPRSQSDSSSTSLATSMGKRQRRGSDWSETMSILPPSSNEDEEEEQESQIVLRPLQLAGSDQLEEIDKNSLLYRRLSKGVAKSKCSTDYADVLPSKDVLRSQSVKSVPKKAESRRRHRGSSIPTDGTCSAVKVQQRTISNRSLPLPGEESEYMRLRNFSITSKKVINRGDSFRSKSTVNVPHLTARSNTVPEVKCELLNNTCQDISAKRTPVYKVLLIGAPEVGKTSLRTQFMTSEYICDYDSSHEDENARIVTVVLNSEESQLEFEEESNVEENASGITNSESYPDACLVMYSVTSRRSYQKAKQLLRQMASSEEQKTSVILVGNKTDLARLRTVTTDEGRSLAKDRGCKFIEISVAINHQVDELLVGIISQIQMKKKQAEKNKKRRDSQNRKSFISQGSKASGVLKKILQRACFKSKSCDNLHVL